MSSTFYFHCMVYGRVHRNNMLDYLFSSLINSLEVADETGKLFEATLLLHTTQSDKSVIENHPNFDILKRYIQIEIILIPKDFLNSKSLWKAPFIMSFCHKYAFDMACLNGSTISFLSPDTVISTNFISRIYDYILSDKYEALLAPAVRLTYLEDFLNAIDDKSNFENRDYYKESRLVRASLNNLHREAEGFYFNNSNFLEYQGHRYPTTIFFDDPFKTSLIGFGMSWFMMAIDTSKIDSDRKNKSSRRLTYETIDAGFLGDLLRPSDESTDYILDSCESFIVSWDQGSGHEASNLLKSKNAFSDRTKCDFIEWGLHSGVYDDFKIANFGKKWLWHVEHVDAESDIGDFVIPAEFKNRFLSNKNYKRNMLSGIKLILVNRRIRNVLVLRRDNSFLKNNFILLWGKGATKIKRYFQKGINKIKRTLRIFRNLVTFNRTLDNGFNISNGGLFRSILRLYLIFRKPF